MSRTSIALATGTLCLLAACGGTDDDAATDVDVSDLGFTTCARARDVGGFTLELADDFTGLSGQVFDGVIAGNVLQATTEATLADGTCELLEAPALACEPACAAGSTCGLDGTCGPYPSAVSVGEVRTRGLALDLELTPTAPVYYYTNPAALPHPGFAAGAGIELTAAGGSGEPFVLRGWGVTPIVPGATTVVAEAGAPLALTWQAPADAGPARVELTLNINGHGLVGSHLRCVALDDGAFEIPADLISTLFADGVSGFPTLRMTRRTSDVAEIDSGCVDLQVLSSVLVEVEIPGLQSCNVDEECTPPATCQADRTCG